MIWTGFSPRLGRPALASSIASLALSRVFGVAPDPTHSPTRNGSSPHLPASWRRTNSQAHMRAAARWNCCSVSRRRVYRMMTAVP